MRQERENEAREREETRDSTRERARENGTCEKE